jgi:hypothetical protein
VDLDAVAEELYGLPLAEFTPTRTLRAKEARAAGDRDLAASITALAKPTKVAWLINQLVRQRRQDVEPLLALGAGLREATATLSGDDLRTLTRQQHQLVHAIVGTARAIAAKAGEPVSQEVADGVDATLRAALADDALAAALSGGRLTDKLEFAGFGGGATGTTLPPATRRKPVVKGPVKGATKAEAAAAERQARIDKAEAATAAARTALEEAQANRDAAQTADDEAHDAVAAAEARVTELREQVERAVAEQASVTAKAKGTRSAVELADRSVRGALRRLDAAQAERSKL